MDPATLIGIGLALAAIFVSMLLEGGDPMSIMLLPPILLVLGGTIGAGMAGAMMRDTAGIVTHLKRAVLAPKLDGANVISIVVKLADRARREGMLSLEDEVKKVGDPFLRRGLELAVDGVDSDELRDILEAEIDTKRRQDKVGIKLFADMGGFAPTIGIIGTVLGLVNTLENLAEPNELGHLIAGAFVATLFGVLTANVIWLPLSNRLKRISDLEAEQMQLVVEGVLAIQSGLNPRLVSQKLRSMVPADPAPAKKAA
ncbi:MAG TPA: flagellar motor protein [Actinophytocola sp.]|uniref:flagellar motor protein n=1 Tax=Actinophytocola sp. TaxID=1872138 RepID=UPI002DBE60E6|nr:flagellar motor protein [Actinophytocola sp.]HEU5474221.1 flagellar motor protein [Actinophytocola sp.]